MEVPPYFWTMRDTGGGENGENAILSCGAAIPVFCDVRHTRIATETGYVPVLRDGAFNAIASTL
jgi:hypothetical protein